MLIFMTLKILRICCEDAEDDDEIGLTNDFFKVKIYPTGGYPWQLTVLCRLSEDDIGMLRWSKTAAPNPRGYVVRPDGILNKPITMQVAFELADRCRTITISTLRDSFLKRI